MQEKQALTRVRPRARSRKMVRAFPRKLTAQLLLANLCGNAGGANVLLAVEGIITAIRPAKASGRCYYRTKTTESVTTASLDASP